MNQDPTKIDIVFENWELEYNPVKQFMEGRTAHGNMEFRVPFMSEIVPGLWQGGCRNDLMLPEEIKNVLSLYPWESYSWNHELDSLISVRMHDLLDQAFDQVDVLASWVNVCRAQAPTLVHCQAGLNRSGLVVARALMLGPERCSGTAAVDLVRGRRSQAVLCNEAFEGWLKSR